MTQPDGMPPEQPVPAQAAESAPTAPVPPAPAPEPAQPAQPAVPAESSAAPAPVTGTGPLIPPAPQPGYAAPAPGGFAAPYPNQNPYANQNPYPYQDPEALAAAAARKAAKRGIFVKSAVLAVPAVVLVVLLAATGAKASALTSKTNAASTAAKSANVAAGLVGQLHSAQSAAEASILVDAGCVAVESDTTKKFEGKLEADGTSMDKASTGTSLSAFTSAISHYINDLQSLSTTLQQDAALSKRPSVSSAVGAVTGDLKVVISAMQDLLSGNFGASVTDKFDSAANRMDADATAVDTMCGGTILDGSGSSIGSGSLSA